MNPAEGSTAAYQQLLSELSSEQSRTAAIRALTARAHDRLRLLAAKIMNESFPRVSARHDVDSVVSEAYLRLSKALESVTPGTPADFFRFAAHKIRQTLIEMANADRRAGQAEGQGGDASTTTGDGFDAQGTSTWDPAGLAEFTEFHQKVELLSDDVKDVFSLSYYLGLSQAEIADATGTHPRQVSRLMARAVIALGPGAN